MAFYDLVRKVREYFHIGERQDTEVDLTMTEKLLRGSSTSRTADGPTGRRTPGDEELAYIHMRALGERSVNRTLYNARERLAEIARRRRDLLNCSLSPSPKHRGL